MTTNSSAYIQLTWHVDEELLSQCLWVCHGQNLDSFLSSAPDGGRTSQKANPFIVVHLVDLVWIIVGCDRLRSTRKVELFHSHLHQGHSPFDEGIKVTKALLNVLDAAIDVPREDLLLVG